MTCPRWLYRWIDERGRIPRWVRWLWPMAHWCPEMDDLLVVDLEDVCSNCFCGIAEKIGKPVNPR